MSFIVNETSDLVIYGAGDRGYACYQYFKRLNFNVRFVIDKDPDGVQKKFECSVVGLSDIDWSELHNTILVICLQNGILHDELANDMHKKGVNKIIFLPTCKKYRYSDVMLHCYRKILEENWNTSILVPNYEEMIVVPKKMDIIDDDGSMITCWVTMEYIFSFLPGDKEDDGFFNKHISCLEPYLTLFNFFQGEKRYPYEYLRIFRGDDKIAQEKLLKDRAELWNVYEEKINMEPDYFLLAAPHALWDDEKKHFKIIDGHHRAMYLLFKGWYNIPIRISRADFDMYIDYQQRQPWYCLKKEKRVVLYKICVSLLKWVYNQKIVFNKVYEHESTKGYVTWWIENNNLCNSKGESSISDRHMLYVWLKEDDRLSEIVNNKGYGWIITTQSIGVKYELQECTELYSGFFENQYEVINLYEV